MNQEENSIVTLNLFQGRRGDVYRPQPVIPGQARNDGLFYKTNPATIIKICKFLQKIC